MLPDDACRGKKRESFTFFRFELVKKDVGTAA